MSDDVDRLNAMVNAAAAILGDVDMPATIEPYVEVALMCAVESDRIIWGRVDGQVPRGIMNAGVRVDKRAAFHASLSAACARRLRL